MSTKRFDAKHIALLSILVALNYVGRVVFQFLPNVQPMTAILLILTLYLGVWDGLIVATLSLILSNMILGMGPWTFAQLFSYAVIILFTGFILRPIHSRRTKWIFVIFALLSGFFYGFVISLVSYRTYGMTNFGSTIQWDCRLISLTHWGTPAFISFWSRFYDLYLKSY